MLIIRVVVFFSLLTRAVTAPAGDCTQPLAAHTLDELRLGLMDVQLRPGSTYQFTLAIPSSYAPPEVIPACATWKVERADKGATISPTGLLTVDPKTPPGSKFVVTADIEHGRAQRRIAVVVFDEKTQPLVGTWKQQTRSGCTGGKKTASQEELADPINELEFRADGWFSVTWTPFETYRDYWGSYTTDAATGALSLKVEQGNYVPGDFQGTGTYRLKDSNTLELTGIYLGDKGPSAPVEPAKIGKNCHYIFFKVH